MRKLFQAIVKDNLNSAEARALANRLDERWLSGDRELLAELVEKDPALKEILGSEITIADLVKKSKCTLNYNSLTQFSQQITLLYKLIKSGEFRTTLTQYYEEQ
ncbi:MAG: hypothetical protein U9N73_08595, partial [Candidatus Auribacterota bacterium]|nr:hypothetical protein [Candidatus Auribacterota bacterium]